MTIKMKEKFDKYWSDYNIPLALETILDSCMKFDLLNFCYSLLDPTICREKRQTIKSKLYISFEKYEKDKFYSDPSA